MKLLAIRFKVCTKEETAQNHISTSLSKNHLNKNTVEIEQPCSVEHKMRKLF